MTEKDILEKTDIFIAIKFFFIGNICKIILVFILYYYLLMFILIWFLICIVAKLNNWFRPTVVLVHGVLRLKNYTWTKHKNNW